MRKVICFIMAGLIMADLPLFAADEDLNFYKEEAAVVSASLRPQSAAQTPATVFVVTAQDIKDSGAIYWWDALRSVPGVDVIQYRTGQGEVGIRGQASPWTNLVLVQVDGRTVNDGYFDHVNWEGIPVTMDSIDRIEIVEGPASAVYGSNAVSGVINIITKKPEQIQGGQTSFTGGERSTYQGSVLYGKKDGRVSYSGNGGYRTTNAFEDAKSLASEAGLFNGLVNYDFSDHAGVSVSGGFNNYNAINTVGSVGVVNQKGLVSYTRADAHYKDTNFRAYWNGGRTDDQSSLTTAPVDYDRFDMQADQSISLPFRNNLVFGATYRRNNARAQIFNGGNEVHEDLWGAFFEDKWDITDRWMAMGSGRVDRHPFEPMRFSPRGSVLYTPVPEHVFRVSAGTSYRNPTLLENYINTSLTLPGGVPATLVGSQTLQPETMEQVEISHTGRFERVKTTLTGFWYRYKNAITQLPDLSQLPNIVITTANTDDPLNNIGGIAGAEFLLTSSLRLFGNYTYQYFHSDSGTQYPARSQARHKVNTGLRTHHGGLTTSWEVHWVDKRQELSQLAEDPNDPLFLQPVAAYFLVNAHVGYAFSGHLNGLEVGVNAFNLLNHDYFESLPAGELDGVPYNGQNAEIVRSRFTGTVSYKF